MALPASWLRAMTTRPKMVVAEVMRMGRIRVRPASTMASRRSRPSRRSWLIYSTSTMPLLTMIPVSITKPTRLITDRGIPQISSAAKPPVKASGMVNMTMKGDFKDWNCATITRYTSSTPRRSISAICPMASMTASFSPSKTKDTPLPRSAFFSAVWALAVMAVVFAPSSRVADTEIYRR